MSKLRIADVMRDEHIRLTKMLLGLMSVVSADSEGTFKKFIEFKWNIEKHFFVEEQAIFAVYTSKVDVGRREVNLISEHKLMAKMLTEFEARIYKGELPDFSDFRKIMFKHQGVEDDYFYTGLETNLNEDMKADIINKTLEVIKA